jgi:hypothetical protein
MAAIGCADDGTSQSHDSVGAFPVENHVISRWKKSLESIAKADHFPTELL